MKTQAMNDQSRGKENSQEAVERRAYELFVARGQEPGHELEDWLQAEEEVGKAANKMPTTKVLA